MAAPVVLIVDDDADFLRRAAEQLKAEGYVVRAANDLLTFHVFLEKGGFDVVVVDEHLPEMLGRDLVVYLKEGRKLTAPIVLSTIFQSARGAQLAARCGADASAPKGPTLAELVREVKRLRPLPA